MRILLTSGLATAVLSLTACNGTIYDDPPPRFNTGAAYGSPQQGPPPVYDAPVAPQYSTSAAPNYQAPIASDVVPPSRPPPQFPSAPAKPPKPPTREYLTGTPVSGKPGFVTSPYAPTAGYVDARGFAPGEQVKCPYSGKIFLVP